MVLASKQINDTQINISQILWRLCLIVSLSVCSSSANKEETPSASEKGKMMLDEIYNSKIEPDHILKIQKNYAKVNDIVLKYFKIGESKAVVISKLTQMKIVANEKSDGTILAFGIKGNNPLFYRDDAKTVEIVFVFDDSNKLLNIISRYFIRE